jgi:hypothetical protein
VNDQQVQVGMNEQGNVVLVVGPQAITFGPADALRIASAITGMVSQHPKLAEPAPLILQPQLMLPNGIAR